VSTRTAEKPWLSGWCNPSNPLDSHKRCADHPRRDGKPCSCMREGCPCAPVVEAKPLGRRVTDQAYEVVNAAGYRTPDWYQARRDRISASEIAAVLGLSPWVSPFDLWWHKRTGEDSQADNKDMRRGHRYEALILEDFAEEHPELSLAPCGFVVNVDRPWQGCTPDSLAYDSQGDNAMVLDGSVPVAVVQAKSGANRSEWGEPGTDEIPVHYRCQVLWEMDTLGLNVAYVPVVFGFEYREYVVEYHEADVALLREAAQAFLTSVREDRMPDIDSHTATARRLKRLHPELVDEQAEIPLTILRQHQVAKRLKRAAEDRMRLAENRIRALAGPAATLAVTDETGKTRTFSHTRSDIKERTQVVRAYTRDSINFPRKDV